MPRGIRRHHDGWQAFIRINGRLYTKHFPAETAMSEMVLWREGQWARAVLRLKEEPGSFAEDCRRYLKAVAGMPTYQDRAYRIDQWKQALGPSRSRATLTAVEIRHVLEGWKRQGLSHGSLNTRRTALLHLWTVLDGKSARNPVKDVPPYREPQKPLRLPTWQEAEAAIAGIQKEGFRRGAKSRARLRVMLWTGLPPAQIKLLTRADLDLENGSVWIAGRQKGRGVRGRRLPLLPQAVKAFQEMDAARAWGAFSVQALNKRLRDGCRRAGVAEFSPYTLRHLFLTMVAVTAKDDRVVAELALHADIRQTRRYTEQSVNPRLAEAMARVAAATFAGPEAPQTAPKRPRGQNQKRAKTGGTPRKTVGGR